jgi:hypothetical protein
MCSGKITESNNIYIFAAMKRELGKWFLDVSKFLFTGVLLSSIIADFEKIVVYILAVVVGGIFFSLGLYAIRLADKEDKKKGGKK